MWVVGMPRNSESVLANHCCCYTIYVKKILAFFCVTLMVSAVNNIFTMCVQVFSLDAKIVEDQLKLYESGYLFKNL